MQYSRLENKTQLNKLRDCGSVLEIRTTNLHIVVLYLQSACMHVVIGISKGDSAPPQMLREV